MGLIVEVLAANLVFAAVALGTGDVVLGWAERWTHARRRPPSLERAGAALLVGFGACAYLGPPALGRGALPRLGLRGLRCPSLVAHTAPAGRLRPLGAGRPRVAASPRPRRLAVRRWDRGRRLRAVARSARAPRGDGRARVPPARGTNARRRALHPLDARQRPHLRQPARARRVAVRRRARRAGHGARPRAAPLAPLRVPPPRGRHRQPAVGRAGGGARRARDPALRRPHVQRDDRVRRRRGIGLRGRRRPARRRVVRRAAGRRCRCGRPADRARVRGEVHRRHVGSRGAAARRSRAPA